MRSQKAGQLAALEQQYMWVEVHEIGCVVSPFLPYLPAAFRIRIRIEILFNQVRGSGSKRAKMAHKNRKS